MAIEIVNWLEIPALDFPWAKIFYESIFEFKIVDLQVGDEIYACFPDKSGKGFTGALVQYDFTKPGKNGPLVYLNPYTSIDIMLERILVSGGKIIQPKKEIASGFEFYAIFEDTEGNMLPLQSNL